MSPSKVSTRAAIYYGDRFNDACRILRVNSTLLSDAKIISPGTTTKLRRRYKGQPVEGAKRDDIVEFFIDRARDPLLHSKLASRGIDLESNVLLAANWRLTEEACDLAHRLPAYVCDAAMRWDHIEDHQIRLMLRGGHAVHKHVHSIARHILAAADRAGQDTYRIKADDLLDESDDPNKCQPVYRVARLTEPPRAAVSAANELRAAL
jgi:hypothetical protein